MYQSKHYTCEEIDERLLKGYYDDAVSKGYSDTFEQFQTELASIKDIAKNKESIQSNARAINTNAQVITHEIARAQAAEQANAKAIAEEKVAIIGTDRISDGAVTSEKIATSAFDDTLSVSGKIAPADVVGRKLTELEDAIQDLDGDTFYITDSQGNIVAKIDADGVKAIEVIAQGKKLSEMPNASDMKIKSILDDFYKEEFYITDGQGNVAFKVTKDGIEYINRPIYETSPFRGQEFFTIGDSLCNSNEWQERFCQIKGAKFNAILNTNHYTKGGTKTLDLSGQCGMDRIRLLLEEQPNAKFIFMQNVNDSGSKIGTITDVPFMAQHNIIYQGQTFTTKADALAAKMSAVNAISHNVGTLLRIPYGVHGKLLRIGSGATNSGTILITLNDVQFGVSVNAGDNVYKVAQAILNWDYSSVNISDTQHTTDGVVDGVVFSDTTGTGVIPSVSFNTGSTGVSLSLENSESVSYVGYCFVSYDINDWNDETKWVEWNTISLCSLYKGIIEYTITHFPTANFAWIAFPHMGYNQNTVAKRADGSYDWDECIKNGYPLYDAQKACCDRMRVPMYNVLYNAGMNVYNFFTYWPNANVHPYKSGYYRWGECLARLVE